MKKNVFYLMSDVDSAIGNFSEIIFYAILKAKRVDRNFILIRKLVFLRSIISKKLGFRQPRALYKIKTEYNKRASLIGFLIAIYGGTYVFLSYLYESINYKFSKLFNKVLKKEFLSCEFNPSIPSFGSKDLFNINSKNSFLISKEDEIYWKNSLASTFNIELDENHEDLCKKSYKSLGLEKYPWFVCLHVRTPYYYNSEHDLFRNSNIENYYDAIKHITSLGGAVVRMGDPMTSIDEMEGLINYPNSNEKSEEMDLYLIKNCKFYIGTNSGIIDTAFLFGVPVLGVNITSFLYISPYKECDSFIYKHIFSKEKNRRLSFEEALNEPFIINSNLLTYKELKIFHDKYELLENSSDDILIATKNMFDNLETNYYERNVDQNNFVEHVKKTSMNWIKTEDYFKKYLDGQYRCASKLFFNGSVDPDFAKKYYANRENS